jgi:hypothetical protein
MTGRHASCGCRSVPVTDQNDGTFSMIGFGECRYGMNGNTSGNLFWESLVVSAKIKCAKGGSFLAFGCLQLYFHR